MAGHELATAYVSLAVSGKGLRRDVDKAMGAATGGVGKEQGRGIGSRMASGMGRALKVGAAAAAAGAGVAVGAALVGGFRSAIQQENTQKTLAGLYGSAKDATGMMKLLKDVSKNSPIEYGAYAKGAESLAYMGIKGKEAKRILENVGAAVTTAGGGGEEMGRASDAMLKMVNAGEVQLDTLNQLSEAGVPIFSGLAEHFGTSIKNVRSMVTEGKVGLEDVLSVTENATGDTFKAMKKASGEVSQSFGNQWKMAKDRVQVAIGSGMRPAIERLAPVIGMAGGAIAGFIEDFGAGEGAAGRFRGALTSVGGYLKSGFVAVFDRVGPVVTSVFEALAPHVEKFAGAMAGLWPQVKSLASTVQDFLVAAFRAAQPYLETAATIIGGVLVGAMRALPPILSGIMTGFQKVLGFVKPLLPVIMGLATAFGVYRLAVMGITAAQKLWTAVTKIGMAVQKAFNAVMKANPIGLVITAITLLVGALVYLYKNNETARRIMQAAWKGIKSAISSVVDWFKNVAWPAMKAVFRAIGDAAKWLWTNGIKPTFTWIKDKISAVFGWIKNTGWPWVKTAFDNIKQAAGWLWDKLKSAFNSIKGGASSLKDRVGWLRDWVKRYFEAIKGNADWLWDKVKVAFNKLKDGVNAVKNAFGRAKDGIGRAWDKVYGKITSPIKKALKWLNKNFIGKLNTLLGAIPGVDLRIPEINTKGFAAGGYTGPGGKYQPAGVVHADEFVLRKEATNKLRRSIGLGGLNYMNQTGQMPGYANGGIVALGKRLQRMGYDVSEHPAFGGVVPGAHSANGYHYKGGALDINADPWNSRFKQETTALDSLNRLLRGEGWNTIWRAPNHWDHLHVDIANGQSGGGGGGGILDGLNPLGWVKEKFASLMGGFDASKYGLAGEILPAVVNAMKSAVAGKLKSAVAALDFGEAGPSAGSGLNLGTKAAVKAVAKRYGWDSGAQWKAIDWIVSRESGWDVNAANPSSSARGLFQKMTSVHGPVEGTAAGQAEWAMRYFKRRYGSPLGAKAFWERNNWYADGGMVKPAVFDNGGTLAPGLNLVNNKLGKPEPLIRPEHAFAGLEITGTLDTPWGPAQVRGIVKDELVSQARTARIQGAR